MENNKARIDEVYDPNEDDPDTEECSWIDYVFCYGIMLVIVPVMNFLFDLINNNRDGVEE